GAAMRALAGFAAPVIAPFGTAAIVIVFVIFILLSREDLRDRVIHLVGRGQLQVTTQALDEAGHRVSRYLLAQLGVNICYGALIGVGLAWIGLPNALLWGFLAAILRFLPYVGPVIGAAFPFLLSLAVSPSWSTPLLVGGLFVLVELITYNAVEPWLYGSSTGLSPLAVIVSAVFWTWLWGAIGLLLATPLTVCIAVLGKYIPGLRFLDIMLGDKPPIAAEERFYQRLLAMDADDALALAEEYAKEHGLANTFDELIVPALRQAETDHRNGTLDDQSRRQLCHEMRGLIVELGDAPALPDDAALVVCIAASNEMDELGALMLARLLAGIGVPCRVPTSKLMTGEIVEEMSEAKPQFVCVSVLSSWSLMAAAQLCKKLRERVRGAVISIGVWGAQPGDGERRTQRLKRISADHIFTTFAQAAAEIRAQPALAMTALPIEESPATSRGNLR
ncbi:MAG TPA: AI-2E family transporter, partial [Chthoniobacteraceae bacterium]|nr:AI-2E family transporter [Chthoniobacteraceae bacterium]